MENRYAPREEGESPSSWQLADLAKSRKCEQAVSAEGSGLKLPGQSKPFCEIYIDLSEFKNLLVS